ncbi:hypothetical protein [Chitinophaga pinensis]|uniref:Uncharacterized protein n=1 Tax=Chitinophaga pinensis (strain ATCC 43595 / DSM 2588 / LMG 13176 / NBRC 15968 / NCIMB 11800 / UQM 2034) TaxID=485918 RepID=A0A979G3M3_CHIPD|nr:hypothetical protein [Chitinophaga pinensis]ACU60083.1 hypothetical protein Cpin_2600 [Chitinophaga pinensis DSM 2588]
MGSKPFYDPVYIIELNEQRLEQYANALQKNTEKFTTLLVLYSALCIFLVPVCQKLFIEKAVRDVGFYWAFYGFGALFGVSLVFAVLQMLPERLKMLRDPEVYYRYTKQFYEYQGMSQEQVDLYVKTNYLSELEKTLIKEESDYYVKQRSTTSHFILQQLLSSLTCTASGIT